jgi:hypothetical protein
MLQSARGNRKAHLAECSHIAALQEICAKVRFGTSCQGKKAALTLAWLGNLLRRKQSTQALMAA